MLKKVLLVLSLVLVLPATNLVAGNTPGKHFQENDERRKLFPKQRHVRLISEEEKAKRIAAYDAYEANLFRGGFNVGILKRQ